jgi:activating signal cointegrator 1
MKALSVMQPWATLIALGAKCVETRSWSTSYRGPLAIHASGRMSREAALSLCVPYIREALVAGGYHQGSGPASNPCGLPLGAVIAVVTLVDVQRITLELVPAEPERSFGDYTPGRFAWFLENVRQLPEPFEAKGALGLWEWKASQGPIDFSDASHQLSG